MKRLDSLQGLRALAFVAVFLGHCGFGEGAPSVSVFFVLSGFVLTYNCFGKALPEVSVVSSLRFAKSRIARLYPLYLLTLMPALALSVLSTTVHSQWSVGRMVQLILTLVANLSLLQAWIPIRSVYFAYNGVAWFLSACILMYFVFPAVQEKMQNGWSKQVNVLLCLGIVLIQFAVAGIASIIKQHIWGNFNLAWFVYIFPLFRLGDFLAGCCAGWTFLNSGITMKSKMTASILEIIGMALLIIPCICPIPECFRNSVVYLPGAILTIYSLANEKGIFSWLLSNTVLVRLGNISGYAYLIHQVVINAADSIHIPKAAVVVGSFVLTMLAAYVYRTLYNRWRRNG